MRQLPLPQAHNIPDEPLYHIKRLDEGREKTVDRLRETGRGLVSLSSHVSYPNMPFHPL